jgi:cytochrome b561
LALCIVLVGVVALIQDSWPSALLHRGKFHTLFGILLWIWVVTRFYAYQSQPARLPADLRAFSRNCSRRVFLLLYLLMFLRLIIGICRDTAHPMHFALEDFQVYLASGCIALLTIRLLAALCRYAALHHAPVPAVLIQRNGRLT